MEQKNFLLAMGLIVGFLLLWSVFVIPRFTPPVQPPAASALAGQDVPGSSAASPSDLKSAQGSKGGPVVLADTVLHDATNDIVFSPKGGAVKSWKIKTKGMDVDLVLDPEARPSPARDVSRRYF